LILEKGFRYSYDAICLRFQVGIQCQDIPSTLQSVFFYQFELKMLRCFLLSTKESDCRRQAGKKTDFQVKISFRFLECTKRPVYLQTKYLYSLVEILQKYAPATCETSHHKSMQEGAGIAQVTAQTSTELGASNPDTGKGIFNSPKLPNWMTMSHTFQSSKYMGLSLTTILPKCEIDHSLQVSTLRRCGAVFPTPPLLALIEWCLSKQSDKLTSPVSYT
jgi:hypothetical protein